SRGGTGLRPPDFLPAVVPARPGMTGRRSGNVTGDRRANVSASAAARRDRGTEGVAGVTVGREPVTASLGIDLGNTSARAIVVDLDGSVLARADATYPLL